MTTLRKLSLVAILLMVPALAFAAQINELRIDNISGDTDEMFELVGAPGESLDGMTYVVIGDGAEGSGVVENATDLTGLSLMDDGLLAVHNEGTVAQCTGYDVERPLAFENSDNVTHLLVAGFTGAVGDDLDTNDDGVLDIEPWDSVLDCVALLEEIGGGDLVYCDTTVGPDGTFVPGLVVLCADGWGIGAFDPVCDDMSPGEPNLDFCEGAVPTEKHDWGSMKSLYR